MISKFSQTIHRVLPHLLRLNTPVLVSGARLIFTSVIITALIVGVRQLGLFQAQELWTFDQFVRLRPDEGPDRRLLVVTVTEADIQRQKTWPLRDSTIEKLLTKLEQYQPRAIGLDIYRDIPLAPGNTKLVKRLRQNDRTIAVCKASDSTAYSGVAPPPGIPEDQIGFSDLLVDSGGILRRSLLFLNPPPSGNEAQQNSHLCRNPSADLYSFSLRLALRYLKAEGIEPKLTASKELKLGTTVFKRLQPNSGSYQNADVAGYQILLNYRSPRHVAQQVTLTKVLTGKLNPNWIKNRIVLIGTTADSIKDKFFTPYSAGEQKCQEMFGVVIHAQAVSQILSAVLDRRPLFWYWSNQNEILWIGAWSLGGGILAWRIRHPLGLSLAGGTALFGLHALCFGFFLQAAWIPVVPSTFAFIATTGSIVLVDRFHQTGYSKAIYDRVKGALKINVVIDQSKKERQVSKIAQTEYFQNLQKKGKELRNRKKSVSSQANSQTNNDINDR